MCRERANLSTSGTKTRHQRPRTYERAFLLSTQGYGLCKHIVFMEWKLALSAFSLASRSKYRDIIS
jgi:hypothetical protein